MKNRQAMQERLDECDEELSRINVHANDRVYELIAKVKALGFLMGEDIEIVNEYIPTPKTNADLDRIIEALKRDRKTLPERSHDGFDTPNWKMIDAQIAICEWAKGE